VTRAQTSLARHAQDRYLRLVALETVLSWMIASSPASLQCYESNLIRSVGWSSDVGSRNQSL